MGCHLRDVHQIQSKNVPHPEVNWQLGIPNDRPVIPVIQWLHSLIFDVSSSDRGYLCSAAGRSLLGDALLERRRDARPDFKGQMEGMEDLEMSGGSRRHHEESTVKSGEKVRVMISTVVQCQMLNR